MPTVIQSPDSTSITLTSMAASETGVLGEWTHLCCMEMSSIHCPSTPVCEATMDVREMDVL